MSAITTAVMGWASFENTLIGATIPSSISSNDSRDRSGINRPSELLTVAYNATTVVSVRNTAWGADDSCSVMTEKSEAITIARLGHRGRPEVSLIGTSSRFINDGISAAHSALRTWETQQRCWDPTRS